ncbi:MAG TPA: hypothetical protein VLI45_09735, partial [Acidobacteriaceae bacterium]|nr:hypothetical protein [Acidobacteriaceae bacterium]
MSSGSTSSGSMSGGARTIAQGAREASRVIATLDEDRRNAVLETIATALESASAALFAANAVDMERAAARRGQDALPPSTLARLKLTEGKLREMVEQVRSVRALPDPLGRRLDAIELDDSDPAASENARARESQAGLHLEKISVPLGVLAVIFEAR